MTVTVDVDGDGERDAIRLTDGVIATCTGNLDVAFEHPSATEYIAAWSLGPDHPMGLLFGSSTFSLLDLRLATWTEDGWEVVTDGLRTPLVLRAGSEGTSVEREHLYDHQCGSEPTQIVTTEVNMLGEVPVVTETTWDIDGTTATATAESHEDPTINSAIWFDRRPAVPCPWMDESA
jgi:hypothetical protein